MKNYQLLMAAEISKASYDSPRQQVNNTGITYSFGGGILHIAYSGTNDNRDILTNLAIRPNFRGCHRGFFDRAESLLAVTLEVIEKYTNGRDVQIILCGHSQGGALAQIICSMIKNKYKYVMAITFGSPKVWLRWCAPKINHIRCVQKDDPVPKLLPLFYAHSETTLANIGEDGLLVSVKAHYIESYIQELEK